MTGINVGLKQPDGSFRTVDVDSLTSAQLIDLVAERKAVGIDGWSLVVQLIEFIRGMAAGRVAEGERVGDAAEFLAIFRDRGFARLLRYAREDGLIDISAYEWDRFTELVGSLGLEAGN
jgi:hypothetical protein